MFEVGGADALDSCQVSSAAAAEQMLAHPKKNNFIQCLYLLQYIIRITR